MSQTTAGAGLRGVDVAGPPDGEPIVFVHGVLFTRALWAPQREALSDEFRVVVPDLPGHGTRSELDFRMERALDLLTDVIDEEAGGSATLAGLSLGGYVATEFAQRNPDMVDALVISGSSANPVGSLETLTRAVSKASNAATKSRLVRRGVDKVSRWWVDRRDLQQDVKREIKDAGFYPKQFGEAGHELAGRDFRTAFAAYPGPALVCNGRWDLLNRLGEKAHASTARDADVEVIAGAGHVCTLERPDDYVATIRRVVRTRARR
ncbi:alpha/beta fold hydrolase [Halomicrobium urmianum]|uniref:alpha/beta fold hydrolase n=1 Tax=Halomicrobium urmianum TaxID=1586233 RepID=UPI001CDA4C68|nr:alpha/beta hydrolase [Halomicrobium urmianum]